MLDYIFNLTNGEILCIAVAAMVLTMVLPRLLKGKRRQRAMVKLQSGQVLSEKERSALTDGPKGKNGRKSEIDWLVSRLIPLAKEQGMKIVYPGMFSYHGQSCGCTLLLAAPSAVVAVRAYGFGGSIEVGRGNGTWTQHLNGESRKIPSPVRALEQDLATLRQVFQDCGIGSLPLIPAAVFTHEPVRFSGGTDGLSIYTTEQLLDMLRERLDVSGEERLDVSQISDTLVRLVKQSKEDKKS